jgi:hypothetical protein
MTAQDAAVKTAPIIMEAINASDNPAGVWFEYLAELIAFCEATIGADGVEQVLANLKCRVWQ